MSEINSFQRYVAEISKIPRLTEDQEKTLTEEYHKTKCQKLRNKLVQHNLRLVVKAAHKYSFAVENVADLFQEGNIGLIKGVEKFDPSRGVKLGNYSYHWIRAYILRYIVNNARLVKIGTTMAQRKLFFNLTKTKAKYRAQGVDISDEELAQELGVKPQELRDTENRLFSSTVRLDAPADTMYGKPMQNRRGNFIERNRPDIVEQESEDPDNLLEKKELQQTLGRLVPEFMSTLSEREQTIFQRRLVQYDHDTLESIGVDLQLTRERIRQIEAQLKDKFKRFLNNNQVSDVL